MPGDTVWTVSGNGYIGDAPGSTRITGDSVVFTASLSAGSATVTASIGGVVIPTALTIKVPDSVIVIGHTDVPPTTENPSGTQMGAITDYAIVAGPTSVSFANVLFSEEQMPDYDLNWPDGTVTHVSHMENTSGSAVDCSNAFAKPRDEISSIKPVQSATHLRNGSSNADCSHTDTWHDRYKNDAGNWVNFCQMTATYKYFGSSFKCQITYQGVAGGLEGPY
jgi:hypothetical protein